MKLKSIVISLNQMSRSGEKHAHDYNLIRCILMALRATYFLSVIYGDPVYVSAVTSMSGVRDWLLAQLLTLTMTFLCAVTRVVIGSPSTEHCFIIYYLLC